MKTAARTARASATPSDSVVLMPINLIQTRPDKLQFRDTPFSETTVAAIVSEGIDLSKFDPIPIFIEDRRPVIGGDGHSRFEAVRRLSIEGRLPREWRINGTPHVPVRQVTAADAKRLSWTANLSRDNFTPSEEAKVFQAMLDDGMEIEEVATLAHKSAVYVRKTLSLNALAQEIRDMIGKPEDAGGVDKFIAQAMAERFQYHKVGHAQQLDLWRRLFSKVSLTSAFVRRTIDKLAEQKRTDPDGGLLFELPANVDNMIGRMRDRADNFRRAQRGIAWLLQCNRESDVLTCVPALKELLDKAGPVLKELIENAAAADCDFITGLNEVSQ